MNKRAELLHWVLTLSFAALGLWVLYGGFLLARDEDLNFFGMIAAFAVAAAVATIPFGFGYLAHQRRWREFLALPVFAITILIWVWVMKLPNYLELLPSFQGSVSDQPDWARHVEGSAGTICFFGSFWVAQQVFRQLLRLVDDFFPKHAPVKDWIRQAF